MVQKYQIVLLDMDNTFLDSRGKGETPNEWAYGAFEKSLRYYGITLTIAEMNNLFIAPLYYEGVEGVIKFCNTFGLDSEEFWARRERDIIEAKIEAIRSGLIKLCNGSEETIKYLNIIKRFHLAVVSDSQQACVDYTLEYFNLRQYFAVWYGRDAELKTLANKKPSPFYINKVLSELNIPREEAILVDDSSVGILAAKNASIDSVLLSHCSDTDGNGKEKDKEKEKMVNYESELEPTFSVKNIRELRKIL